ncbi:aminomethyl-transferring glycine dehydrogenase [Hymenobacter busanensis]|uniref:Glycine dehydrogenase (decarboxylating) n=1 Tax=Hymenobacter busanensis TaxID=2607656 RepID=A0A7L4ZYH9_9BACT|nr:aminomethyl-transferring glycine dehydrogenase [Hymenobacter busanensis]KAA9333226.1 aminomethyl-transferring glycine dehydrogenase [Hymenobacter busanensis]QHJ08097.1 aminomethyl-transferring glycine dehydrogenase [Hymenobacter busanensis]
MKLSFKPADVFVDRHNGPDAAAVAEMLHTIGVKSVDQLINETVPARIRLKRELNLPAALTERQFLRKFKAIAGQNQVFRSFIGLGYHDTQMPPVILRNIMENPGWYTAYTPYQAEIAQGRLEALINYQTMVIELTGLEIANASLLDEGTAAAEALHMFHGLSKKKNASKFFVSEQVLPQTIDVLRTRATPLGIELVVGDHRTADLSDEALFGAIVQYPAADGEVFDYTDFISKAHDNGQFVVVAADLLALTLLTAPGEMGADAVVGNSQRFGVPLGYGGPHAGFLATKDAYKRVIPGRIIGQSVDATGNKAYRMALQTREQHIRREKATSNICTAQVLLSVIAGMYAVYHGPERLKQIATNVHLLTRQLAEGLQGLGVELNVENYFDTVSLTLESAELQQALRAELEANGINLRYFGTGNVGISLHEKTEAEDVADILRAFAKVLGKQAPASTEGNAAPADAALSWPKSLIRTSEYLTHPVFNTHHSEHELLRYMKQLENKDLSLTHSMISLGSCTMKLNATAEMIPVTWPEIGQLHPFAPREQAQGYAEIFRDLEAWLCEITGFDAVSLQPNSGAQGEYAGLLVIKAYHEARGDHHRNVALIPASAHGTNPASAVMCGMQVVVVKSTEKGEIDLDDLRAKAEQHSANLSCLMVTYPSTHGVYEESIIDICNLIHEHGGRVYMDGANMNAQVGLTSPANIGADVCHLNLHKTFCIPHGGGGPGVGPIGVVADLAPYLPGHVVVDADGRSGGAVSAAPWGSASILPISYAYINMMGGDGLKAATQTAILNANYIKARLEEHYPVLYTGQNGRCAHEMILDCRQFKKAGIEVEDIAKRLMDYGYHAPTVSFPVAGTLMVEPTESESKEELDRFCEAMISIREEIRDVEEGRADAKENLLKHAPHTAAVLLHAEWTRPYSREQAAYPTDFARRFKFWPSVSRIDSAFGDRNLICACTPIEAYADQEEHLVPTDKGPSY